MNTILTMSLYASIMVVIIVMMRIFFITKLPKKTFKILWLLAALRMLIPFFVTVRLKMPQYLYNNGAINSPSGHNNTFEPVLIVWLTVAFAAFSLFAAAYLREIKKYKDSRPAHNSELAHIINSFGLSRKVSVKINNKTETLLTYGIIKPQIICPQDLFEYQKESIRYALSHELIHIKNFDALYKLIIAASVCIHWFNPFSWIMLTLASRDTELSCDEELLKKYPDSGYGYALALIEFEEKRNAFHIINAFGKNAVKERIELIMKFKKATVISVIAAVCIVSCTAAVFAVAVGSDNTGNSVGEGIPVDHDELFGDSDYVIIPADSEIGRNIRIDNDPSAISSAVTDEYAEKNTDIFLNYTEDEGNYIRFRF